MRPSALLALALLVACEAPPVPPSAAPSGPAVPAAGDVPPGDGGLVTGAPGAPNAGGDGSPIRYDQGAPGADGALPAPDPNQPPPGAPGEAAPPPGAPGTVTPAEAAAAAPPGAAPTPTEGPPSFKVDPGKAVKLAGEVTYSGAAKGTYRLDFFQVSVDARPMVLAVKLLDGPGSWEVEVPQGTAELYVMAYIDGQGDGPDPTEPAAVAGPLTIGADAVRGVTLALTPGGAGQFARDPSAGNTAGPPSGVGPPGGAG